MILIEELVKRGVLNEDQALNVAKIAEEKYNDYISNHKTYE